MNVDISGVKIAMLGGDLRELELAAGLLELGADLRLVGFSPDRKIASAKHFTNAIAAVVDVDVVIAPMVNTDFAGLITTRLDNEDPIDLTAVIPKLKAGTLLLVGVAKPIIISLANQYKLRLVETASIDEIAILNSIPTAEGALQIAMEETLTTIHGSKCLVVGFGRCGKTMAISLKALGANVSVADRNKAQLAYVYSLNLAPLPLADLIQHTNFDIIFNTVPALVITRPYLEKLSPDTLIIDLAAAPGGVDFVACDELGIKAILALSLPGKVAPVTAGKILFDCIPQLLQEMLGGGECDFKI